MGQEEAGGVSKKRVQGHLIEVGWPKNPGDFKYTGIPGQPGKHGIVFACPCGCGDVSGIEFDSVPRKGNDNQRWSWNGSVDKPTLTPSLHKIDGCRWHGFLRTGVFVEV